MLKMKKIALLCLVRGEWENKIPLYIARSQAIQRTVHNIKKNFNASCELS